MSIKNFFTNKANRKKVIIASSALSLVLVVGIGATVFAVSQNTRSKRYSNMIKTAEKELDKKDYDEAISMYEEAIELNPQDPDAYLGLVDLYLETGDIDKAFEVLDQAVENVPEEQQEEIQEAIQEVEAVSSATVAPVATEPTSGNSNVTETTAAPTETTVVETEPIAETDPVIETDPVVETDPAVETEPVAETDPAVETEPTETTIPEDITISGQYDVATEDIIISYLTNYADDFGGYSVIGKVFGSEAFENIGGEICPPALSELQAAKSGVATYVLYDVDADDELEAIVLFYNTDVESVDNEITAVLEAAVIDVVNNEAVVSDSKDLWTMDKSNGEVVIYFMDGTIVVEQGAALTPYTPTVDGVLVGEFEEEPEMDVEDVIFCDQIAYETIDSGDQLEMAYSSISMDYADTAAIGNVYERFNSPAAYVDGNTIVFDNERYPELQASVNEAIMDLDEDAKIVITRSDIEAFSFVVINDVYTGYNFNPITGEEYTAEMLGIEDVMTSFVMLPIEHNAMIFNDDDFPYIGSFDAISDVYNYVIDVTDFGVFIYECGESNLATFEIVDGSLVVRTNITPEIDGFTLDMADINLDTLKVMLAGVNGHNYLYVIGEANDGSEVIVYTVDLVVEPDAEEYDISTSSFESNPFGMMWYTPSMLKSQSNYFGKDNATAYYHINRDGQIALDSIWVSSDEPVEATTVADINVANAVDYSVVEVPADTTITLLFEQFNRIYFMANDNAYFVPVSGDYSEMFALN